MSFTKAVFQDQSLEIIDADPEVEAELYTNEEGRGSLDRDWAAQPVWPVHIPTWVAPTRVQILKYKFKNVEKYNYKNVEN